MIAERRRLMKRNMTTILLFVVLFVGLALLLYPSVSDFYNSFHQSRAVATYNTVVEQESKKDYEADWAAANAYNEKLRAQSTVDRLIMTDEEREEYDAVMNVGGSGIIGVIEIPQIAVTLPLYHSTNANVLQVAVGHIEGTSLPTGEPGTHSAFSAHRGLPSAKLFTNLDQLTYGDTFTLRVLDKVLTYEIDPHDVSALQIYDGMDLCTLVTCTPYGINSHRLLVRGHRVETSLAQLSVRISADALVIDPYIVAPIVDNAEAAIREAGSESLGPSQEFLPYLADDLQEDIAPRLRVLEEFCNL
jgi:sortase A